jgi:hypothetical protein
MCTLLTALVTWDLTSTLVRGATVPAALSNTGKSRCRARTVVTEIGPPGLAGADAGALAGVAGAATSVFAEQPRRDTAASPHAVWETILKKFMMALGPVAKGAQASQGLKHTSA